MIKILIVEDNNDINELLRDMLSPNYEVIQTYSGTEALTQFQINKPDLILLDIMLPGKNGGQVLSEIRAVSNTPVIMLTAISHKKSVAEFLVNGADDYVTKPFDKEELLARILVCLRNKEGKEMLHPQFCGLELDLERFELKKGQASIPLRLKEMEILNCLFQHPKQIFTKEKLYETVWGEKYLPGDNVLNTHLSNLRKKIKQLDENEYIETVWGLGIRLKRGCEK